MLSISLTSAGSGQVFLAYTRYAKYMLSLPYRHCSTQVLCAIVLLLLTPASHASRIYKSINADGSITYSSRPPDDAVSIEEITLPSDFDMTHEAETRANFEAIKKAADQLENERKQREQKRQAERKQAAEESGKPDKEPPATIIQYYPVFPYYYPPYRPVPLRPYHPYHPPRLKPPPRHPPESNLPPLKRER